MEATPKLTTIRVQELQVGDHIIFDQGYNEATVLARWVEADEVTLAITLRILDIDGTEWDWNFTEADYEGTTVRIVARPEPQLTSAEWAELGAEHDARFAAELAAKQCPTCGLIESCQCPEVEPYGPTNDHRANLAGDALEFFAEAAGIPDEDVGTITTDLLVDLFHLVEGRFGYDLWELLARAHRHYGIEAAELAARYVTSCPECGDLGVCDDHVCTEPGRGEYLNDAEWPVT